jgi:predicted Ser/Thr protein kinase
MTNDLVGRKLGKYEIQAEIGKGGMGMVYQGYDPLLDRRVAVKVLAPHLVWEPGFIERFLREARSAARLKHASIVTIYDVGQEGNWYYIVMEYLEGETLGRIIRRQGPLPVEQVLAVLRQLAKALDYAHQHSLVHRDVKPGNIVVDPGGQVTLTDFGVARAAQETRLTTTGALVGTPQYMSPEQAQGEEVDHRTDVYSLGVVAYEMLAGRAPFGATTPHAVLHRLIYDPPPSARSRRPDLPAEVDHVLSRALAKKPAGRYETAGAFVNALGQALTGKARREGVRPRPAVMPKPQRRPPARPRRSVPPAAPGIRKAGWALWFGWLLVSAGGWALGWLVAPSVGESVSRPIAEAADIALAEIVGGAVAWGILGLFLGVGQWLLLRRHIRNASWWVLASVAGWAVTGSVKWIQGPVMEPIIFEVAIGLGEIGWEIVMPLIGIGMGMLFDGLAGLVVGSAQWLVLQRQVPRAGRWVLISVVAWATNAVLIAGLDWAFSGLGDEGVARFISVVGGIVPAVITATGLVRLLSRSGKGRTQQP